MKNYIHNLSIVLAVFNEEKNIELCLVSVKDLSDDIVVVDGGSHDNTVVIANRYATHVIATDNPPLFHINKQKALQAAKYDWVLQLDADEVVTYALAEEIRNALRSPQHAGYSIPRRNYFLGDWLRKGGQYPDYVVRLVHKKLAHFPCKSVHEQIEIKGSIGKMSEPLLHYSYTSLHEYFVKMDRYTTLTAIELKNSSTNRTLKHMIVYMLSKPMRSFLSMLVRHKGILDGWRGITYALLSAMHYPVAYVKYIRSIR